MEKAYGKEFPQVELNIRLSEYSKTGIKYEKYNGKILQLFLPPQITSLDSNQKRAYLAHEFGHYVAAEQYDLEPEIEFEFENVTGAGFNLKGIPVAYTSFNEGENKNEIVVVALTGPFINILLGIILMFLFIFLKGKVYWREFVLIGAITSIGSGLMNLLPFYGSDGALVWGLIRG